MLSREAIAFVRLLEGKQILEKYYPDAELEEETNDHVMFAPYEPEVLEKEDLDKLKKLCWYESFSYSTGYETKWCIRVNFDF